MESNSNETTETLPVTEKEVKQVITNAGIVRISQGLTEIGNLDIADFSLTYNITRSIANLSSASKAYSKCLALLNKTYAKSDEAGKLMLDKDGYLIFETDEQKSKYSDEFDKLNETVVEVKLWRLRTSALQKIKGIKATSMAKCHELIDNDSGIE